MSVCVARRAKVLKHEARNYDVARCNNDEEDEQRRINLCANNITSFGHVIDHTVMVNGSLSVAAAVISR